MRFAIIGRSEILFESGKALVAAGHQPALVVSCKEAPEYRVGVEDFEALAGEWRVPFVRTTRSQVIRETVEKLPPIDIGVSINFLGVIPQSTIDAFQLGILNAHGGDLPRYRGNACQAWAILQGEPHVGLCVHRMIGGELDSGDILAYGEHLLDINTKVGMIWDWMASATPGLMVEAVNRLAKDPGYVLRRQSKDPKDALRCYPRAPEDGKIDWRQSATSILRLINASGRPYAGAFCELEGSRLTVWDAALVDEEERYLAVPGQVTAILEDRVEVATGSGKIALRVVEASGSGACSPTALIKSIRTRLQ